MSIIKGNEAKNNATQGNVTVTTNGQKVGLDVTIAGAASEAGINPLASGSILSGLDWRGSTSDISAATVDTITYYSDAAKTALISTVVITYDDATKADVVGVTRTDV